MPHADGEELARQVIEVADARGAESPERRRYAKASGQAMEFAVWRELIQQSRGMLHVFLPLLDNGLDGVVHRLTDGQYVPVQVKSRDYLTRGKIEVVILANSLVEDRALIIAGLLTDDGLGPMVLVVDEGTFKRLAAHGVYQGIEIFEAAFSMHPTAATRWRPYLVPRSGLAATLLGSPPSAHPPVEPAVDVGARPQDRHNDWLGFLGESEVIRRLAENSQLDLFRPFPDLELVEVLARNNTSGRFAGLQVKTAVPGREGEAHLQIRKATFVTAASSWIVGLAWLPELNRFADQCLVIPTQHLREIAIDAGDRLLLLFYPESPRRTPLDPYRRKLSDLGALIARITDNGLRAPH